MSMNAVALIRVSLADVKKALGEASAPEGGEAPPDAIWVTAATGPVAVVGLEDATLLYTGVSIREADPEELGTLVRAMLGEVADGHDDERGVLVFPDRARPDDAETYDAVAAEAGDLGDWVALPSEVAEVVDGGMPPGLEATMGQVMGAMGGDPSQMGGLWAQAQKLMADPEMQAQMMSKAQQMMAQMQTEGGGMDFGKMASQAQEMLKDDPELVERLSGQLDGEGGDGSEDDEG